MNSNRDKTRAKHQMRLVVLSGLIVYYSVIIVLYIINTISMHL